MDENGLRKARIPAAMGIYFIKDPDGCCLEIVPSDQGLCDDF